MALIQRAKDTGKCPPSLLSDDRVVNDDGFETEVLNLLEPAMPGAWYLFYVCFYVAWIAFMLTLFLPLFLVCLL